MSGFLKENEVPCTRKIDDRFDVTIRSDRRRSGGWEAEGTIFATATGKPVGPAVSGEGRTLPAAEQRAFAKARSWCLTQR